MRARGRSRRGIGSAALCRVGRLGRLSCLGLLLVLAGSAHAQTATFSQLDFDLDGTLTPDSDWGALDLSFVGSASILYLNLTVNGLWQLQNLPVTTTHGAGVVQTQRFWFDLGVPVGTDVGALSFDVELTPEPQVGAPANPQPAIVGEAEVRIANGGVDPDFPETPAAAAGASIGGPVSGIGLHKHDNFPNQETGLAECAPTAVSNSLQFLNTEHDLGMEADDISIDAMKSATNWGTRTVGSPGTPGVQRIVDPYPPGLADPHSGVGAWIHPDPTAEEGERNAWWQDKSAYMESHDLPITTRQILPGDIAELAREMDRGQDIEAELGGHTVAVTAIADLGDGRYSVTIAHDSKQGAAGGTVEETGIWDPATSSWDGALSAFSLSYFVVECPEGLVDHAQAVPGNGAGAGAHATFGTPDVPALPANFFDPGSDPFTGQVPLRGVDDPAASVALRRYGDPIFDNEPLLSSGEVDVEIVALDLVSLAPIVVSSNGGSTLELWHVRVTLSVPESFEIVALGEISATKLHANGGSFDAEVYVQPVFTFTRAVAPFDARVLDTGGSVPALRLSGVGMHWVHEADPVLGLPTSPERFRPGILEIVPGAPVTQQLVPMPLQSEFGGFALPLVLSSAPVVVPAAKGLGQIGMVGLIVAAGVVALRGRGGRRRNLPV